MLSLSLCQWRVCTLSFQPRRRTFGRAKKSKRKLLKQIQMWWHLVMQIDVVTASSARALTSSHKIGCAHSACAIQCLLWFHRHSVLTFKKKNNNGLTFKQYINNTNRLCISLLHRASRHGIKIQKRRQQRRRQRERKKNNKHTAKIIITEMKLLF